MMSDGIDVAPAVTPPAAAPSAAARPGECALDGLGTRDLARMTFGFYFLFWGTLVFLAALTDSLGVPVLRMIHGFFLVTGSLGLAAGAWRLYEVRSLGDGWHKRARELLIVAALLAYLVPFYLMWRRLPLQVYLLAHALAMLAIVSYALLLLCQTVAVLGRLAGRRSLVIQAVIFATVVVVMLFPPFALFGQVLVQATRAGSDPLALLQAWLSQAQLWVVLALLLPFSLTLSLVWAGKDLVLERLLAARNEAER